MLQNLGTPCTYKSFKLMASEGSGPNSANGISFRHANCLFVRAKLSNYRLGLMICQFAKLTNSVAIWIHCCFSPRKLHSSFQTLFLCIKEACPTVQGLCRLQNRCQKLHVCICGAATHTDRSVASVFTRGSLELHVGQSWSPSN